MLVPSYASCFVRVPNIAGDVDRARAAYEGVAQTLAAIQNQVNAIPTTYADVTAWLADNAHDATVAPVKAQVDQIMADQAQLKAEVDDTLAVLGAIQSQGIAAVKAKLGI